MDTWRVFEADESDRSLLRFDPEWAVITNITRDHFELGETATLFQDFARRVDMRRVGKRPLEMLARAGAFDMIEESRSKVLKSLDSWVTWSAAVQAAAQSNQSSLFGGGEDLPPPRPVPAPLPVPPELPLPSPPEVPPQPPAEQRVDVREPPGQVLAERLDVHGAALGALRGQFA